MGLMYEINKAIHDLRKRNPDKPSPFRYFYTEETGLSDETAVKYFEDSPNIIVVTRDGTEWHRGEKITDA